jgi:hypothetical protein
MSVVMTAPIHGSFMRPLFALYHLLTPAPSDGLIERVPLGSGVARRESAGNGNGVNRRQSPVMVKV